MSTYTELMKRLDRDIETKRELESVFNDLGNEILTKQDALEMVWDAMQDARAEGYRSGWNKEKQIKR